MANPKNKRKTLVGLYPSPLVWLLPSSNSRLECLYKSQQDKQMKLDVHYWPSKLPLHHGVDNKRPASVAAIMHWTLPIVSRHVQLICLVRLLNMVLSLILMMTEVSACGRRGMLGIRGSGFDIRDLKIRGREGQDGNGNGSAGNFRGSRRAARNKMLKAGFHMSGKSQTVWHCFPRTVPDFTD